MLNLKILFIVSVVAFVLFISIHKREDRNNRNRQSDVKKQGETWAEVIHLIYIYSYAKHL